MDTHGYQGHHLVESSYIHVHNISGCCAFRVDWLCAEQIIAFVQVINGGLSTEPPRILIGLFFHSHNLIA